MAHPSARSIVPGLAHFPLGNGAYLRMLAANVGAVIMLWMIFYQQGAMVDKQLLHKRIKAA